MSSNENYYIKFCLSQCLRQTECKRHTSIASLKKLSIQLYTQTFTKTDLPILKIDSQQEGILMVFKLSEIESTYAYYLGITSETMYEFNLTTHTQPTTYISIIIPFTDTDIRAYQRHFNVKLPKLSPTADLNYLLQNGPPITPEIFGIIHKINNCKKRGVFKKYYLENKIEELILLQLEVINNEQHNTKEITENDYEKIILAHKLLVENLQTKITIPELAKLVGTNECKLKKQFKLIFNKTIYGYLTDYKMQQAKYKMQDLTLSIKELSDELGFKSQNHFSTAFKKYYGLTPSNLLKN